MSGWIFGSEQQAQWTQKLYKHRQKAKRDVFIPTSGLTARAINFSRSYKERR